MIKYRALLVYDSEANFVGWVINTNGTLGLKGTNIFGPHERDDLIEQLARLNEDVSIRQHWPHLDDPDVQKLLQDETWEPYETEMVDVVDEEKSHYVYRVESGSEVLDEEASTIVTRPELVAKHPSDISVRNRKAMESVARARAKSAIM